MEPVTPESPCGEDVRYDGALLELETEVRGKPETQFSKAEEPDWNSILEHAAALFGRSKHLRPAVLLTVGLLEVDGLPGVRAGLTLLNGLVERYWDELYPRLDPEDGNDPLERLNILSALVAPLGTFGDPLRFVQRLRRAPLFRSPHFGVICQADLDGDVWADGTAAKITRAQISTALQKAEPGMLTANHGALTECIALVESLSEAIGNHAGGAKSIEWEPVLKVLTDAEKTLRPFANGTGRAPAQESPSVETARNQPPTEVSTVIPHPAAGVPGAIQSRAEVVQTIERICEFYRRTEPSSPVPLLLQRAQRLAEMDFVQIIENLAPDALSQVRNVIGDTPPAQPVASDE